MWRCYLANTCCLRVVSVHNCGHTQEFSFLNYIIVLDLGGNW